MVTRLIMLDNLNYTIDRPIEKSMVNYFKNNLLNKPDIYVYYLSDKEDNSLEMDPNVDNNKIKQEMLMVTTEKTPLTEMTYVNNVAIDTHQPIMEDKEVLFLVRPRTIFTTYRITIKYFSRDKNRVLKIINLLRETDSINLNNIIISAEYYYTIPLTLLKLIHRISKLKNVNYGEYFKSIQLVKTDFIKSREGLEIPVIREKQGGVLAYNTTDPYEIKPEKDDQYGYYAEMIFELDVEVPTSLMVTYPILVYNKLIGDDFIPRQNLSLPLPINSEFNKAFYRLNDMGFRASVLKGRPLVYVPTIDEFPYAEFPLRDGHVRLLSILLMLDEKDPYQIMNLNELRDLGINDFIYDYMKTRIGRSMFVPVYDLFQFELFEDFYLKDLELYLDKDLNIRSKKPINIKSQYRLALNVVRDLKYLNPRQNQISNMNPIWEDILNKLGLEKYFSNCEEIVSNSKI